MWQPYKGQIQRLKSLGFVTLQRVRNHFQVCRYTFASAVSLHVALAGCASGGANTNSTSPPPLLVSPAPPFIAPPPSTIDTDDTFNTPEFKTNYGLLSINAHTAYAQGVSGDGITVAVIDDGIDIDHPDLVGNISPLSIDIRTGLFAHLDTQETHGTQIAGIIAAERNNSGSHGVAYDAEILMIRALDQDGSVADVVAGVDYARENGAHILNLSLTSQILPVELRQALDRAVDAGMLIVLSAGNNLNTNPAIGELDAISTYATFDSANGHAIAVGAIDKNNNLFFLSNRPGTEGANVYILAPGVDIISTTVGGGLYQLDPNPNAFGVDLDASGTSFAAPHVAGAAAVLWQMFPNLNAQEVIELLLTTSVDVGAPGVDSISGHGIINLGAAVQPQGELSIALDTNSFGRKIPLANSRLHAGAAFGDAVALTDAFDGGFVQDRYRRAYPIDFRALTSSADGNLNIEGLHRELRSTRIPLQDRTNLSVSVPVNNKFNHPNSYNWIDSLTAASNPFYVPINDDELAYAWHTVIPGGTALTFTKGYGSSDWIAARLGLPSYRLRQAGTTFISMDGFTSGGKQFTIEKNLSLGVNASFHYADTDKAHPLKDEGNRVSRVEVGLKFALSQNTRVAVTAGQMLENKAVLGLAGTGAFDGVDNSMTRYVRAGVVGHWQGWKPYATAQVGMTDVSAGFDSVIKIPSNLWTTSFGIGAETQGVFQNSDTFSVSASQPIRVERGYAILDLATSIDANDNLSRRRRELNFTPTGRQVDLNVYYTLPLGGLEIVMEYLWRHQPVHSIRNPTDSSLFVTLRTR
jgi:subtilisin family serine protease